MHVKNIESWFVRRTAWKYLEVIIMESEESSTIHWKILGCEKDEEIFNVRKAKFVSWLPFSCLSCLFCVSTTPPIMNGNCEFSFFTHNQCEACGFSPQENFRILLMVRQASTHAQWWILRNLRNCKSFSLN